MLVSNNTIIGLFTKTGLLITVTCKGVLFFFLHTVSTNCCLYYTYYNSLQLNVTAVRKLEEKEDVKEMAN